MLVIPICHTWDEGGDRCTKCGDKDWFAGPYCNAVHVYGCRLENRAFLATPAGAELLMLAAEELTGDADVCG